MINIPSVIGLVYNIKPRIFMGAPMLPTPLQCDNYRLHRLKSQTGFWFQANQAGLHVQNLQILHTFH